MGRIAGSPVCWVNKEILKPELIKDQDVETEKVFNRNKETSGDLDKHFPSREKYETKH